MQRKTAAPDSSSYPISSTSTTRPPFPPPPPGRPPSYYRKRNFFLVLTLIVSLVLFFGLSFIYTNSLTFGLYLKFKRTYGMVYLTPDQLSHYKGINNNTETGGDQNGGKIYISIKGHIIDVTTGKDYYGPESGYHVFSGRDATRAFLTGCFATGATHDLRGFTEAQMKSIDEWLNFYLTHETYIHVGYLKIDPIPDDAPLPNDKCAEA